MYVNEIYTKYPQARHSKKQNDAQIDLEAKVFSVTHKI